MAISPIADARDIVFDALDASSELAAVISDRLYPSKVPTERARPFVRIVTSDATPDRYAGVNTGKVSVAVHFFETEREGQPDPETATAEAVQLIAELLDAHPRVFVDRTTTMSSGEEPDDWHGIVYADVTPYEES